MNQESKEVSPRKSEDKSAPVGLKSRLALDLKGGTKEISNHKLERSRAFLVRNKSQSKSGNPYLSSKSNKDLHKNGDSHLNSMLEYYANIVDSIKNQDSGVNHKKKRSMNISYYEKMSKNVSKMKMVKDDILIQSEKDPHEYYSTNKSGEIKKSYTLVPHIPEPSNNQPNPDKKVSDIKHRESSQKSNISMTKMTPEEKETYSLRLKLTEKSLEQAKNYSFKIPLHSSKSDIHLKSLKPLPEIFINKKTNQLSSTYSTENGQMAVNRILNGSNNNHRYTSKYIPYSSTSLNGNLYTHASIK